MSTSSLPVRWLQSLEWRRGFFAWARTDGVTWVYIFKVLAAAFITLWLAMRLELPQPRTAMITVFIVMQPQSGHVFAKSFYRVLGTLAGSAMMVALIAIFPQNTELFLPSLALWVGLCSAGAMRYRTFRAYGFVLAGYTAAMIGLPVLQHPDQASWRRYGGCWRLPWAFWCRPSSAPPSCRSRPVPPCATPCTSALAFLPG